MNEDGQDPLTLAISNMWKVIHAWLDPDYEGNADTCIKELFMMHQDLSVAVRRACHIQQGDKCHIENTLKFYLGSKSANGSKGYRSQLFPVMNRRNLRGRLNQSLLEVGDDEKEKNSGWNTNPKERSHQSAKDVRDKQDSLIMCIVKSRKIDDQNAHDMLTYRRNPASQTRLGADDGRRTMQGIDSRAKNRVQQRRTQRSQSNTIVGQRNSTTVGPTSGASSERTGSDERRKRGTRGSSLSPATPLPVRHEDEDSSEDDNALTQGYDEDDAIPPQSPAPSYVFAVGDEIECEWNMTASPGKKGGKTQWYPGTVVAIVDGGPVVSYGDGEKPTVHDIRNCRLARNE